MTDQKKVIEILLNMAKVLEENKELAISKWIEYFGSSISEEEE